VNSSWLRTFGSSLGWAAFAGCAFAGISGLSLVGASGGEDLAIWYVAGILSVCTFVGRLLYVVIRKR